MTTYLYCCKEYKVDSDGFIISKRYHKPMKPSLSPHGYLTTTIMINGERKTIPIHSAVAKSFLGDKTSDGLVINHKDGNKQNNHLDNLEWVTQMENVRHAINELGFNQIEGNNPKAKAVIGKDKKTFEVLYSFPALIAAGRYFANGDEKRARYIQGVISRVIKGTYGKKTYKGCLWEYDD